MKKKMKKLSALLMAVAMVLSLSVTAWASDPDPIPSQEYGGDTGDTTEITLPQRGSANGTSTSEGPEPADPIEVVLPTVTAPTGDNEMGVFDMILDPHNMIAKTQGARYAQTGVTKTFDTGVEEAEGEEGAEGDEAATEAQEIDYTTAPKLYFATKVEENAQTYSGTSQTLKIINKGRKEVNVNLSLDFTYPDEVTLVSTKDDLANAETGLNDAGAQMYLALVQGETTQAVAKKADDALPAAYVDGPGDYLAGTEIALAWGDDVDDAIKAAVANLTFTVSYADPVAASTHAATQEDVDNELASEVGDTVDDAAVPATITIAGTWGDYVVTGDSVTTETEFTEGAATISATVKDSNADDAATLATVTFSVLKPNDRTMDPNERQTVHFKKPENGTVIKTAIAAKTDAYEYAHWDGTGTKPQGTTPKGYYWKQADIDTVPESMYPYITFKLVGDINNDLEWDGIYNDAGITFTLTWDVLQRSTYNKAIVETAVNENTGEDEEPEVVSEPPTVTVTTTATSSRQLVLTWTEGTGDYEGYTPGTSLKVGSKTITLTKSGQKLTASGTASTNYNNIGSATASGTITFTASGKDNYTVTITGMRT